MNAGNIQSTLYTGLLYSKKALSLTAQGALKISRVTAEFIATSVKEIVRAAPGVFVDIVGPQIGGAGYTWVARPLAIGTHSLRWKQANRPNAAFNAFSLPVGRAIIAVPQITQAVDAVANVTSKVSDSVTNKIPRTIVSEQAIQMLKQHTKNQFIFYLEALVVYKFASAFFKVDKPEPSITAVINPVNLVWVGFAYAVVRLLAYLNIEELLGITPTEEPLSAPVPIKAPIKHAPPPKESRGHETDALAKMLAKAKTQSAIQPKKSWRTSILT